MRTQTIETINSLASHGRPFVFAINYNATDCRLWPIDSVPPTVAYNLQGFTNDPAGGPRPRAGNIEWAVAPEGEAEYARRFNIVRRHLLHGDSYLVNLTTRMELHTNLSLRDIYARARAKYKLLIDGEFTCFSPETFLQIRGHAISCFPMKGTIADAPGAEAALMANEKEAAEHATIVDLIRNDLSMVAGDVRVERYRYAERLHTNHGNIIQTSSRITGRLARGFESHLGEIIFSQLPAGSVTGAPKPMTLKIIDEAENYRRGFYTGVMGCWHDGCLDSAVMIRFIDTGGGRLWYKAGGGITAKSDCHSEYLETLEKVYVPLNAD